MSSIFLGTLNPSYYNIEIPSLDLLIVLISYLSTDAKPSCIPSSRIIVLAGIWPLTSPLFFYRREVIDPGDGDRIRGAGWRGVGVDERKGGCW